MTIAMIAVAGSCLATGHLPPVSGGIGESGREIIRQHEQEYPLKLIFTGQGGMYLSDVDVTVIDAAGRTIEHTTTEGPVLLLDLPDGTYRVTATAEGISQTATVLVKKGTKTYYMRFDIKN